MDFNRRLAIDARNAAKGNAMGWVGSGLGIVIGSCVALRFAENQAACRLSYAGITVGVVCMALFARSATQPYVPTVQALRYDDERTQ